MVTKNSRRVDFAFVIATYTNTEGLKNVLNDISKHYKDSVVVIVNNDPRESLEKKISSNKYPLRIIVKNNNKNEGFGRAVNDGTRLADETVRPNFLVFINDDVRFSTDWITPCIDAIKKNKWSAAAPVNQPEKNYGYIVLPYGKIELIKSPHDKRTIDGLTAAALVIKKDDFFLLRGFDPSFFAYLEDVDLFLRAKKRGLRFGVVKNVSVFHEGQKTSSQFRVKKAYLDFRNWIILIVKNWGIRKILLNFPAIFVERLRNLWGIVKTILSSKF